jgi:diguanylate cyclase (GGDEF)-like protein
MGGSFAFLLPVMMVTVGASFLILYRCGVRAALPWAIGFLCSGVGFTAPFWNLVLPRIPCAILADGIFATAFFAYGRGLIDGADRGIVLRIRLAAFAAAILASVVSVALHAPTFGLAANDLCCAVLLGTALLRMQQRLAHPIRRLLFMFSCLVVLETLVRGVLSFLTFTPGIKGGFLATEYAFLMQATAGALGLPFALSALASLLFDATAGYRRDAMVDPLSGLLNRRGFEAAVQRLGGKRGGAVIACDIDHFKRVNDLYGHPAGDAVIAGIGTLILTALPRDGFAGRSGGEEFTIVLPRADIAEATRVASAIRAAFTGADWRDYGISERLTASLGVALVTPPHSSWDQGLEVADQALYDAKRNGRDRVSYRLQMVAANEAPVEQEATQAATA